MSHLVETTTNFTKEEYITGALKKMGISSFQVYSEKTNIADYYGKTSNKKANIVVKKGSARGIHSDVGFEKMENGTYKVHHDGMDSHQFMEKLTQSYSQVAVEEVLENQGFSLNSTEVIGGNQQLIFNRWK